MMTETANQVNTQSDSAQSTSSGSAMDRRIESSQRRWKHLRLALVVVGFLATILLIWQILPAAGSTDVKLENIQTGEIKRTAFDDYLPIRATVVPAVTTLVGVLAGGQVEERFVEDGAFVTKGQPLAQLANPDLQLEVLTQEVQIASQLGGVVDQNLGMQRARVDRAGQIAQAEYDLVRARRALDIRRQLRDQGFVSEAGVKGYQEEVRYQEKRLSGLQSGSRTEARITETQDAMLDTTRRRLQSNLSAVRASLDALIIRAPLAGRLTNFTLQPGQTLSPGNSIGQIDSEGAWKLQADVDEYYLGRVKVGQQATTDNGSHLTISKVLPTVTDGRFKIELTFNKQSEQRLNRGQTINVQITLGASKTAIVAPVGGWLTQGGNSVFVLDDDNKYARRVPVQTGRRNPRQVEILSGLEPGQRIITSELPRIDGDIVNIN